MTALVLGSVPLGFVWPTVDPFLFCVHHLDAYPAGNAAYGVDPAQLVGRKMGADFEGVDGWRMYHGEVVPGFPSHPHRGFETLTVARQGFIDHSDSLGAAARFGQGDAQWMTAGRGIVHSEMFPLLAQDRGNPAELFQLWINLPRARKMAAPHFAMLWSEAIPRLAVAPGVEVVTVAGTLESGPVPPPPPPDSWAADPAHELIVWTVRMAPGAAWSVPAARAPGSHRVLYLFDGEVEVGGQAFTGKRAIQVDAHQPAPLRAGPQGAELLVLGGVPIGEPVAQEGPFVMNERHELREAFADYRRTAFGGWPWPKPDPIHAPTEGRFARLADGTIERP